MNNRDWEDPDKNNIKIYFDGMTSIQGKPATYLDGNDFQNLDLNSGHNIQAWIDYDHLESQINVTIIPTGSISDMYSFGIVMLEVA